MSPMWMLPPELGTAIPRKIRIALLEQVDEMLLLIQRDLHALGAQGVLEGERLRAGTDAATCWVLTPQGAWN